MQPWTDSSFRQGRDDHRPRRIDWWPVLGLLLTVAAAVGAVALVAVVGRFWS